LWIINNELYHHGIKGQKWGQRNYQNKDGSLTAAGEARYLVGGDSAYGTTGKHTVAVTKSSKTSSGNKKSKSSSKKSKKNEEWQTPGERLKNKYKNDKKFRYAVNTTAKAAVITAAAVGTRMALKSAATKKGAKIMDDLKAEGLMKESDVFKGRYEIGRAAMDEYTKRMGVWNKFR
jgi:hypothetical protein